MLSENLWWFVGMLVLWSCRLVSWKGIWEEKQRIKDKGYFGLKFLFCWFTLFLGREIFSQVSQNVSPLNSWDGWKKECREYFLAPEFWASFFVHASRVPLVWGTLGVFSCSFISFFLYMINSIFVLFVFINFHKLPCKSNRTFSFGDGVVEKAIKAVRFPVTLGDCNKCQSLYWDCHLQKWFNHPPYTTAT